jgi:hypothetical protein
MNLLKFLLRLMANDFYTIKVDTIRFILNLVSKNDKMNEKSLANLLLFKWLNYQIKFVSHGLIKNYIHKFLLHSCLDNI